MARGAFAVALYHASGFFVFSSWVVFAAFSSFLLPLWTLSFATEGLGREREARNLLWVLTRPLSRPAIYLAKFAALLPWCLLLNLGGFALICLAGGRPGRLAFTVYWPAAFWGTLAYASLFHLFGALLRRPAVVALLYSFFLEAVAGNMPGQFKRLSISYYVRCLMFDRAHEFGIQPERPQIFAPVGGTTAWLVLAGVTVFCVAIGALLFTRNEQLDVG
jgi:ABC-2 type transport system permease protein